MYFKENVKPKVVKNERILLPVKNAWDSFFLSSPHVSDDFLRERAEQPQYERN
ncbi:hypothetical protein ACXKU5_001373 [Yersinia enterocolitica]|nr:hypothetical protein [Yersinia enterocolitica]EKN4763403.1 hypothetical protein [Yersinia enterocolitica]ELI7908744.1 hypothetical protein [Yersinia enterocolitica]ELI8372415.1 hypothetical protein [Yersinia enterocolitica]ELW8192059.1 hypothetical protein [Yersinia enterocolitica]